MDWVENLNTEKIDIDRLDGAMQFDIVKSTSSQLLLAYFGEHKSPACGKCDVCLKVHKEEVNNKDFKERR